MATTIGVAGLIGKGIIDYNQLREKEKFLKKERELKSNELTEMTNRYEADKNNLLEQNLAKNQAIKDAENVMLWIDSISKLGPDAIKTINKKELSLFMAKTLSVPEKLINYDG